MASRTARIASAMACLALAVLALQTAGSIILEERWGPVIATIDAQAGMGVHLGDLVGVAAGGFALLCGVLFAALLGSVTSPARARTAAAYRPRPVAALAS